MKKAEEPGGPKQKKNKAHVSEPSVEQWGELFEAAGFIKKMRLWESFYESDIFTILLPGRQEPVYVCVLGNGGECMQVNVYPDNQAMAGFFELRDAPEDEPFPIRIGKQKCLTACFGDRDEVTEDDRAVYTKLGLKFRGKGQWIYFRSVEPGFVPWKINSEQAELLCQALQNFLMMVKALGEGKITADFDNGETVIRWYDPQKKLWFNTTHEFVPFSAKYEVLTITDELFTEKLKKCKQTQAGLSLDMFFMPAPIQEKKGERPYFPRMILLADDHSGTIIDRDILSPEKDGADTLLRMLSGTIIEYGRPASLCVRGDAMAAYVEDLCKKTGVRLIKNESLPVIDAFIDSFSEIFDQS